MPLVKGRKRRAEPEDDDDASAQASPEPATQRRRTTNTQRDPDSPASPGGVAATQAPSSLEPLVKSLVRLALACEYNRRPLRRTDISEKVLQAAGAGRNFKDVFARTQIELGSVFGMTLVELPTKEKKTVREKRKAQAAGKGDAQGSKAATSWVLTSILPAQYRQPEILAPAAIPTAAQEATYTSVYTLLTTLIALSGGSLSDAKMSRHLARLDILDNSPVEGFERTEKLLKRLERDGYVVKVRETLGTGDEDVNWFVGPRGKVEVGDHGAEGLARVVYGELDGEPEADLGRRIARSLGINDRPKPVAPVEGEKKRRGRKPREEEAEEQEEEESESGSE